MNLSELLTGFSYKISKGTENIEITELVFDSRKTIVPGAVFVCISGAVHDGHAFAQAAVEAGAAAIIAEHEVDAMLNSTARNLIFKHRVMENEFKR